MVPRGEMLLQIPFLQPHPRANISFLAYCNKINVLSSIEATCRALPFMFPGGQYNIISTL